MMKVSRGSKGFTLIELLIVVMVIGILAAIAIPVYSGYSKRGKVAGVVHSMGAIKNALAAYYTENGAGPADIADANVKTVLYVDPARQYASSYTYTAATRRITATVIPAINLGAGQTLALTADLGFKTWNWSASTCDAIYIPKN
jgi:prepilin-type N-terminal cleavage/methylation domain-containing protein